LKEDFVEIKSKLDQSSKEVESLKIQGERNTMQMDKTIHEKEMQVSELLKNFQNDRNSVNEKNEGNEFRDLENMEGGLVDVKKQIALAATTIKNCPKCAEELYEKLDNASQQLSTISQAICPSTNNTNIASGGGIQHYQNGSPITNKTGQYTSIVSNMAGTNCAIVGTDLFRRCESEEQLLDAPGDIDSDLSVGKTSQFTRYTTTIEVNPSQEPSDSENWEEGNLGPNANLLYNKKGILDEMQHHLTQMEQELAIVGEESKDLQQRLITRQEELKKKCLEVRELAGVVEHLRYSNVRTTEQLERSKNRAESISCRLEETRANFHQLEAKASSKDFLIITIIDLLLTQIEETACRHSKTFDAGDSKAPEKSASYFVQRLRQTTVRPSKLRGCGVLGGKGGNIDFNLEVLCSYIESEGRRRRRESYSDEGKYVETMQEDKSKKTSDAIFSLSTFPSKAKESSISSRSGHSSNRTSFHNQQPISFSGLPLTSMGELTTNSSTNRSYSNYIGSGSNNEKKFPLLTSAGVSPTLMIPSNFRVTRRVGSDSLLVAWTTPDDDEINGYLIYVDDTLHQRVRSSSRTKALLHDLDLNSKLKLGIHSIGMGNTVSNITFAIYDPKICVRRSASFSTTHPSINSTSSRLCK